jgi:hypothetical protein
MERSDDRDAPFPETFGLRELVEYVSGLSAQIGAHDLIGRQVYQVPIVYECGMFKVEVENPLPFLFVASLELSDEDKKGDESLFVHLRSQERKDSLKG